MPMTIVTRLVYNKLPALTTEMRTRLRGVVRETKDRVEREAKASMQGPKHGRTYRRGAITRTFKAGGRIHQQYAGSGLKGTYSGGRIELTVGYRYHRASAPGEAPAVDTGNLRAGTGSEMVGNQPQAFVFAQAVYAKRLETKMNRAFLKPAAEKFREWFNRMVAYTLNGLRGD